MENQIKVGVGVMVVKDGKILMGKRLAKHAGGEYATPGGHLEHGESFFDCARREVAEECGLEIKNIRFLFVTNLLAYLPKHYVHINLVAEWAGGEPQVLEPEKCESWDWYDMDNLPEPYFFTTKMAIDSYKTGQAYFE